jgi:hypothetical protein
MVGTREGILIVAVPMIACAFATSPSKAQSKRTASTDEA